MAIEEIKYQETNLVSEIVDNAMSVYNRIASVPTDSRPSTRLVPFKLLLLSCCPATLCTLASRTHRRAKKEIADSFILSICLSSVESFVVVAVVVVLDVVRILVLGVACKFKSCWHAHWNFGEMMKVTANTVATLPWPVRIVSHVQEYLENTSFTILEYEARASSLK